MDIEQLLKTEKNLLVITAMDPSGNNPDKRMFWTTGIGYVVCWKGDCAGALYEGNSLEEALKELLK